MARGRAAQREHDAFDRTFFAGLLIVLGLLGSGAALVHRHGMAHSSRSGDACPVTHHGGIVGFDAVTGDVRWTNVVPTGGWFGADEATDAVVLHQTPEYADGRPDRFLVVDRTIDPDTGAVTACGSSVQTITQAEQNEHSVGPDPMEPPVHLDGLTIVKWADGIRATDATNTGVWSIPHGRASAVIGDEAVVTGSGDGRARTRLLDLRTGAFRWSVRGNLINVPSAEVPVVVVADATHRRQITGYDLATGAELWTGELPALSRASATQPAVPAGELAIVPIGPGGAHVAALEVRTGRIRWQTDGGSPGRNRQFPEPGWVSAITRSPDGSTVIVAVTADPPDDVD